MQMFSLVWNAKSQESEANQWRLARLTSRFLDGQKQPFLPSQKPIVTLAELETDQSESQDENLAILRKLRANGFWFLRKVLQLRLSVRAVRLLWNLGSNASFSTGFGWNEYDGKIKLRVMSKSKENLRQWLFQRQWVLTGPEYDVLTESGFK